MRRIVRAWLVVGLFAGASAQAAFAETLVCPGRTEDRLGLSAYLQGVAVVEDGVFNRGILERNAGRNSLSSLSSTRGYSVGPNGRVGQASVSVYFALVRNLTRNWLDAGGVGVTVAGIGVEFSPFSSASGSVSRYRLDWELGPNDYTRRDERFMISTYVDAPSSGPVRAVYAFDPSVSEIAPSAQQPPGDPAAWQSAVARGAFDTPEFNDRMFVRIYYFDADTNIRLGESGVLLFSTSDEFRARLLLPTMNEIRRHYREGLCQRN